jgi:inner membrane organizing system protein 1
MIDFCDQSFHENTNEFYFFGGRGRGGDFLIDNLKNNKSSQDLCALHHQCITHINKKMPVKNQLHAKYDKCIDLTLRRFMYGALAGVAFGVLLFRRPTTRCASIAFGVGAGLGSAHAECSQILGIDNMPQWFSIVPKWPR